MSYGYQGGYKHGYGARQVAFTPTPPVPGVITPGNAWNGVAGSGFTTTPAADPRSVAKPALRLLVPPNQYYSDTLMVGFACAANDNGSLLNTLGVSKIVVYYEGNQIEIQAPSYRTFNDVNGVPTTEYGWWCDLARANATNGDARLYAEAYPRNPIFQKRLEGPYQFSPYTFAATGDQYDFKLSVAPSQPQITGVRYQSMVAANTYLVAQAAKNPLITAIEAGSYDMASIAATYQPNGRFNYTGSVPVTFAKAAYTTDAAALMRSKVDGMHFFGANVTIDMANVAQIYQETPGNRDHWFDGVRFTDSLGRGRLIRGGARTKQAAALARGKPWFTECNVDKLPNPGVNANLVRGGHFTEGYSDVVTDAACVVGLETSDWTNNDYADDKPAMLLRYSGAETTATFSVDANNAGSLVNGNDANARRCTLKWGANVATYTVENTELAMPTNYWFSHIKAWIDGLGISGMVATVLDNSRRATFASLAGMQGKAFGDTDIKSADLTVVAMIDLHNDWWQTVALAENAILYNNRIRDFVGAAIFPTGTALKDALLWNIASYNSPTSTGYDINVNTFSQWSPAYSHVVMVHVTLASQGVRLQATFSCDAHCLIAVNSIRSLVWLGTVDNDLVIKDNHLQAGFTNPANGTGTTIGGDHTSLYVDGPGGNFAAAGALLANLKPRVVADDINGKPRAANDVAGAVAA